jgi:hypothetical protein
VANTIDLNLGSDLAFTGVWKDENGAAMNMTGYSIALFNAHPMLSESVIAWTNAATGAFSLVCQHRADWFVGRVMSFRIRVSLAAVDISSPEVWVSLA